MFSSDREVHVATNFVDVDPTLYSVAYGLAATGRERILIGVEGPMSGSQKDTGRDLWRGARLAARELNQDGGILGLRIKLIKADDKADPDRALKVAERLERKGVAAVIGPYNSSVGLVNLPFYIENDILPLHLTSTDLTDGFGITIQPKNSQIAPVEVAYMLDKGVQRVSMLVDPSAFTVGMANRVQTALEASGVLVERVQIEPGATNYGAAIGAALASSPDLIYVSTYYPEGSVIARGLAASGSTAQRFMGLANVDPAFVTQAGLEVARTCVFSGVPEAAQLPTAASFVTAYEDRYNKEPGVWGVFAYDSLQLLAVAMDEVDSTAYEPVLGELRQTSGYVGETGVITIDPLTGNRIDAPVFILNVNKRGEFVLA